MSINDFVEKVKPFYYLLLIIVIFVIFLLLGRLSMLWGLHEPIKIEVFKSSQTASVLGASTDSVGGVSQNPAIIIGSRTGKKYYFPWCGTVKKIKPENQIKFSSIDEAKRAGFTPAGNCKGLK